MKKSFTQFIGGDKLSIVSIILFLIALLPNKGWAQSYSGESGVVLTYEVSGDKVTITGMTTVPSDGKLVIPGEIEGKEVTRIENQAFYQNTDITSVEIAASVTNIGPSAFHACTNLSEIHFAEDSKLTTISTAAFYGTNIKEITIPETVTLMVSGSFDKCANLTSITMLSKTPCSISRKMFDDILKEGKVTIYVPADALEAYKTASRWSDYASIIQAATPTSISHTTTSTSATSVAIYTLDGKLANKDGNTQALAKGIYVQNGKKVVIGK